MIKYLIDKLLRKEEIMRGDGQIYLRRWTLFRSGNGLFWKLFKLNDIRIYIHKFINGDHTNCLHDHPNDMISFIFKNGYDEEFWDSKIKKHRNVRYKAPCLRSFSASHAHRVTLINNKPAWSLVLMFSKKREWGFFTTNTGKRKWVSWKKYYEKFGGNKGCD